MSPWDLAALGLVVALGPCAIVTFRGDPVRRLVGLEAAGVVVTVLLVVLAEAFHRPSFFDLPLTLALLAFGGGLVFARFLEGWL